MTAGARVLIVDDNEAKRYVKARVLQKAGFDILEASDADGARGAIVGSSPDLVLLDVRLPDGDGRDLCAWVKRTPELARIVVLQTSACVIESKDRVASLDAGADGYLVEPIEDAELVANVRALLRMRQAEAQLQQALAALREADRRKDEFLAMLAHELRNPLAPIRNAVEILSTDDERLRERARTIIRRQVGHMARLVDDLLEVSRITQGKVALKRSRVTLRSVVEVAVETAHPTIHANAHHLRIALPADDVWLHVDAVRIAQAIGNMLHNAAKFTPRAGIIELAARRQADEIEISVHDNGIGISPDSLPHVFDLFTQDDSSLDRAQGGLGIGLALVRGMARLHDGNVCAESAGRGQGSCFRLRLPIAPAAAGAPEPALAGAKPSTRPCRVLVIEDDIDAAETVGLMLQGSGHHVTIVNDAREAMDTAIAARPDVVLLDIGLPGMDGYELAQRLRRAPQTRGAYIVAVSGFGQDRDRARSAAAGFDLHLTKPVEPERLAEALSLAELAT